jgi:hypothetical protein
VSLAVVHGVFGGGFAVESERNDSFKSSVKPSNTACLFGGNTKPDHWLACAMLNQPTLMVLLICF